MRALVFGSSGMLGQDLTKRLEVRGHTALGLSRREVDITKLADVRCAVQASGAALVFNCAAYTKVDMAENEPGAAFAVNGAGARNVAAAAAEVGAPVVHLSTDYVFAGSREIGYEEWEPMAPLSVYGKSKALGEAQVRAVNQRHIVVRTQWLFGSGGSNFVATMLRLGKERPHLQVVADQVGSPTYTADLADALVDLAEDRAYGTYHVTNSGSCSWAEFARTIFRLAGMSVQVESISTRELDRPARRPLNSVLLNRMWQADGRQSLRSYEEALSTYLEQQWRDHE